MGRASQRCWRSSLASLSRSRVVDLFLCRLHFVYSVQGTQHISRSLPKLSCTRSDKAKGLAPLVGFARGLCVKGTSEGGRRFFEKYCASVRWLVLSSSEESKVDG